MEIKTSISWSRQANSKKRPNVIRASHDMLSRPLCEDNHFNDMAPLGPVSRWLRTITEFYEENWFY